MKTIVIAFIAVLLALDVSAQRGYGKRYSHRGSRTRTSVSIGINSPYYYPGYYYGYARPNPYSRYSRLDMEIADIKADYRDKIWSARHDKSISRSERKRNIHELKSQRDRDVRDAERNYYARRRY